MILLPRSFSRKQTGLSPLCIWALFLVLMMGAIPAGAEVLINEIMADPASDWDGDGAYSYRDDEWVEVVNTGPETVDLTGYWLRDGTGDEAHLNLFGMLAAGDVAVFTGSQAVAYQAERGLPVEGLSLNNVGDTVDLLASIPGTVGPELDLVDSVIYLDHEAEDDRSSGRDHLGQGWFLYDGLNPYGGSQDPPGTGCYPSFSQPNECQVLPTGSSISFGDLKAAYR